MSIIGIAEPRDGSSPGANAFTLTITDPGGLAPDTLTAADFTYTRGAGSTNTSSTSTVDPVLTFGTADIPAGTDGALVTSHTTTVSLTNPLVSGDRLTLKSSRVKDVAGNLNSAKPGTAAKAQASPRITSVLMSGLKHSAHNSWTLPAAAADATTADDAANEVTITAKATGDAAGAAGNAWTIVFDTAGTYSAAKPLDIDVRVDTKGKRATVRFVNGQATVHDLVAALRANEDFDSRFAVSLPCSGTTRTPLAVTNANRNVSATPTNLGRTQFAIEVNFNRYISSVDAEAHDALLRDLLAAAATRAGVANTDDGIGADAAGAAGTAAGGGLSMASTGQTAVTGPTKKVRYQGETAVAGLLPMARDLVETAAGAVLLDSAVPSHRARRCSGHPLRGRPTAPAASVLLSRGTIAAEDGTVTAGTAVGGLGLEAADPCDGFAAPGRIVRYEGGTALAANLPKARDLVTTDAGARLHADNPATTAVETDCRPAVPPVANGFAADVNTTAANAKVDEGRNGFSQVRISPTASVKARN